MPKYKLKEIKPKKTKGLIEKILYVSVVLFEYKIIKEVPKTGKIVKILGYCKSSEKNIIDSIIKNNPEKE